MSQQSSIEWTDATWNPVRGCRKISPGCKHCYAETFAERFCGVQGHPYEQGFDMRLVPHKLLKPLTLLKPRMIFVNSMSDLFQDEVPYEYIELAFEVMLAADWHTYQVLTKRAGRMVEVTHKLPFDLRHAPHIWLGVSVEDRKYGVPRIAELRRARAHTRFLSVEPLLEDVGQLDLHSIDWVIVGGESGHGARQMEADWVRSIQVQCAQQKVAFFFKQWGGVRKKKTGRLLDGRTWNEFPGHKSQPVPDKRVIWERQRPIELKLETLQSQLDASIVFLDPRKPAQRRSLERRSSPGTPKAKKMPLSKDVRNQILRLLAAGRDKSSIAEEVGASKAQVAAVAAHVTMGTYKLPTLNEPLENSTRSSASSTRSSRSAPQPRSPAASLEQPDPPNPLAVLEPSEDAMTEGSKNRPMVPIVLGLAEDGQPVTWSPDPAGGSQNPHVLILGSSGSGKTYATLCLIAELAQRGIPSVVFDYGQGFSLEALPQEFLALTNVVELDLAREGVSLNPLRVTEADLLGPTMVAQRFADSMSRVFPQIGVQQHAALREAVLTTLRRAGITSEPKTWTLPPPPLHELRETLREASEGSSGRHAASVEAHISSLFVFNTFRPAGRHLSWESVLKSRKCVTVLQLRGLESSLKKAVTELLLWDLWAHFERMGTAKDGALRMYTVLDEAHNIPMGAGSASEKMLREGRKFGVAVLLASQQPDDFTPAAYGNAALKLVFRISHDATRLISKLLVSSKPSVARAAGALLTSLARGHAIVLTGALESPVHIKIRSIDDRNENTEIK